MEIIFILAICALIIACGFLLVSAKRYKDAYIFLTAALSRICLAEDTYAESLSVLSAVYKLDEKEIVRRLQSESKASSK